MADYSKGIIYTIRSKDNIYVGSTLNFRSRKNKHKSSLYNENGKEYNIKLYKTIRANECEWDMQPYSKYPCKDILELTIEEERVRQLLKADMNSQSCGRGGLTPKEYQKQYNDQHKDKIEKYKKQWYEENKNEISEQNKQRYEEHKDEINEKNKQYHKEHKNEIREKKRQKVTCECGCVVAKGGIARHHKSKKHIDLIAKLNQ